MSTTQVNVESRPPPCVHDTEKLCITTQLVVGTVHRFRADSVTVNLHCAFPLIPMSTSDPFPMDHDDEDDFSCSDSVDDEPPFAIVDPPSCQLQEGSDLSTPMDQSLIKGKLHNFVSPHGSQETEKTTMGSSILYSPVSQSISQTQTDFSDHPMSHDSGHLPDEFIDDDIEFDAAASLLAESPMLGRSSHFMTRSEPEKVQPCAPDDSMGFSELMHEADDQNMHHANKSHAMPTLPEDAEMDMPGASASSSVLTPRFTNHSTFGHCTSREKGNPISRSPNLFRKRGIETQRVDQDTFEVSMHIYSDCSKQDVMDIVGNPDLLRLWCEPVRTLVVTRSSEGARSAANRRDMGRGDREVRYEPMQSREIYA